MLAFLYTEGSWTRGIFRRPAGARAVRELRDTLDSGTFELPLTRDHVFVIAGVFKVGPRLELGHPPGPFRQLAGPVRGRRRAAAAH